LQNARLCTAQAYALIRLKRFSEALRDAQHAKLLAQALTKRLRNLDLKIVGMIKAGQSLKQRSGELMRKIEEIRSKQSLANVAAVQSQ
jgi:hypothetical protein